MLAWALDERLEPSLELFQEMAEAAELEDMVESTQGGVFTEDHSLQFSDQHNKK